MCKVSVLSAQISQLVFVEGSFSGFRTRRRIDSGRIEVISGSSARRIGDVESRRNRKFVNVKASGTLAESRQQDVSFDRLKRRRLSEGDRSFDSFVRERSSSNFSFDLTNLCAGQKAFRMFLVEQNEVERSVAVQFREFEVDVCHVVLGEHALLLSDFDFTEFSGQIAFATARPVFFRTIFPVFVQRIVEELKKIAGAALDVAVRVEDVGDEDLPRVGRRLGGGDVDQVGQDFGLD